MRCSTSPDARWSSPTTAGSSTGWPPTSWPTRAIPSGSGSRGTSRRTRRTSRSGSVRRPCGHIGRPIVGSPATEVTAPHVTACQIRWIDLDAYRHVNNTVYLRYLEQARIEMVGFLAGLADGPPRSADFEGTDGFVIAELEIAYRRPLVFRPEPVEVQSWVTHLGRTSWAMR